MALRFGDRYQETLLPASIEEYVTAEDPVRVYDAFVEALDLGALGIDERHDSVGNTKYDPRAMLKLLVYGYSYGIRSSRKLERACHHNLSFIWLVGGLRPDHKTIANFRRMNAEGLRLALQQSARFCLKLNLIEGNVLFVDGTKMHGNVSKARALDREDVEARLREVSERIDELLHMCEQVDADESGQPSFVAVREELRTQQALQATIAETLKEFKERGVNQLNHSDKESRMLKGSDGYLMGYNAQVVTDKKHGLIVQTSVADSAVDCRQLPIQVLAAEKNTGVPCTTVIADAGYASNEPICELIKHGVEVLVPDSQESRVSALPVSPHLFTYDETEDQYVCPEGHRLPLVRTDTERKQKTYRITSRKICRACCRGRACTKGIQGRTVKRSFYADILEKVRANFATERAQRLFALRKIRAEHPFAYIKETLGYRRLLVRGKTVVQGELALMSLAYNIRKMWGIMGVRQLTQALG